MPKAVQYKPNSVIYFAGDVDDRVFLLQKGHVALNSIDIETGKQITEYIKEGEFFGVKSALGHFPREESAMVITDSIVLAFLTAEFEAFAQNNTRIIMKMLKVFSNQLRHVHRQTESLLHSEEQTNPDDGMFSVANCLYGSQQYKAASEVAVRYLKLFPSGKHVMEMKTIAQNTLKSESQNRNSSGQRDTFQPDGGQQGNAGLSANDPSLAITLAEELSTQKKWNEAYKQYHSIIETGDSPVLGKAYAGAGKCLYEQTEYVRCIQLLTTFVGHNPKSLQLGEILMYMGLCYQKMDQADKAKAFFGKALTRADPMLAPKIKELYSACGG